MQKLSPEQIRAILDAVNDEIERGHQSDQPTLWAPLDEAACGIPQPYRLCREVWVSEDGRIATSREYGEDPRELTPTVCSNGYLTVGIHAVDCTTNEMRRYSRSVHRLVLAGWDRQPRPGEVARHLDGIRSNNRISNLSWGTMAQNAADARRHGTARAPGPRLTAHQRAMLIVDIEDGELTYQEMADLYQISPQMVRHYRRTRGLPYRRADLAGGTPTTPVSDLSPEQRAMLIRDIGADDLTDGEIAERYGVSQQAVSRRRSGGVQ